jgi:hypothetical protein
MPVHYAAAVYIDQMRTAIAFYWGDYRDAVRIGGPKCPRAIELRDVLRAYTSALNEDPIYTATVQEERQGLRS